MIEAPSFSSGSAFCTVKNNRLTLVLNALSKCFLGADLKRRDLSYAGIGEHDIEAIEGFRYLGIEVVQVSHPTDIRGDADCSPANVAHRGDDRYPIAAGDNDPDALSGEGLGGGKADPAITAGNKRDFSVQSAHSAISLVVKRI
jgi:hypothetical protein